MSLNNKAFLFFVEKQLDKTDLPNKWKSASFDDFPDDILNKLGTDPLFVFGNPGIGKTHYLAAMIRHVIELSVENKTGESVLFVPVPLLLYKLRCSYDKGSEEREQDIIKRYTEVDWLFLDDFGADRPGEWARNSLYLIIDELYRNERKLSISSNISLNQIAELYDDRMASRIMEMCHVIKFTGEDKRKRK